MNIACMTFTNTGEIIANNIASGFGDKIDIFKRSDFNRKISEEFHNIFKKYDGIIFISSTGIAVRFIAPHIKDKTIDPAVIVVDDMGRYAISLLSGHLGGANILTHQIAKIIGAQPVITTASDGRNIEAVDMFAKRHQLVIESMEDAKKLTAMMLECKRIQIVSEGPADLNYPYLVEKNPEGIILISSLVSEVKGDIPMCILCPKLLNVGVGCRRGKNKEEILQAINKVFDENHLALSAVKAIGTIDIKQDEKGIIDVCNELGCKMKIFTADEIRQVQHKFVQSNFVQSAVGVTSVSEPCAYLAGGKIVVNKTAINGVTIAVSKEDING